MPFKPRRATIIEAAGSPTRMKTALEALSETFAAGAAILWFL
jgi:hypothetical protein